MIRATTQFYELVSAKSHKFPGTGKGLFLPLVFLPSGTIDIYPGLFIFTKYVVWHLGYLEIRAHFSSAHSTLWLPLVVPPSSYFWCLVDSSQNFRLCTYFNHTILLAHSSAASCGAFFWRSATAWVPSLRRPSSFPHPTCVKMSPWLCHRRVYFWVDNFLLY